MRGFTLLEVMLSAALLLLMTALVSFCWVRGLRSWTVSARMTERSNQLQLVLRNLERELLQTQSQAVILEGQSLSFPSPYGLRGQPNQAHFHRQNHTSQPLWSKYQIYSYRVTDQNLALHEEEILPSHPAALTGLPLTGLSTYLSLGKVVARHVTQCQFDHIGPALQIRLEWEELSEGGRHRRFSNCSTTVMRN